MTESTVFADHFTSKEHEERLQAASILVINRLQRVGKSEDKNGGLLMAMSDAMGTAYGLAAFYKSIGLHHHASILFEDLKKFVTEPDGEDAAA